MSKDSQKEAMRVDFRDQLERARAKEIVTTTTDLDNQPWSKRYPERVLTTKRLFAAVSYAVLEREKTLRDL